jgi:hypothetical protein
LNQKQQVGRGTTRSKGRLATSPARILALLIALALGKMVVFASIYSVHSMSDFLYFMSTRWDANWFVAISQRGYWIPDAYAFSPFFPALIRLGTALSGSAWVSGLVLANFLSFLVPIVVYRAFGFRGALLFELFPTYLVYTAVPYSEPLVLLVLALGVLAAVKGRFWRSSALVSLAVFGTYSLALALPSFLVRFARERGLRALYFYALPLLSGVLVLLWFRFSTGNFLEYFKVEAENWKVGFTFPWTQALFYYTKEMTGSWPIPGNWTTRNLPFEVFYIVGAVLLYRGKAEGSRFLSAFSFSVIAPLFFIFGGPAESIPRLLLPAFPVFLAYSQIIKGKRLWLYVIACLLLTWWVATQQALYFFA